MMGIPPQVDALQTAIIEAAKILFAERGIRDSRLSDVAKKAGVSLEELTALYETKSMLMLAIHVYSLEQTKKEYLSLMPDLSLVETVKYIISSRCRFMEKNIEMSSLFFRNVMLGREPWSGYFDNLVWELSIEFASLFEKGVRDGQLKKGIDVNVAVRSLTSFYLTAIVTYGFRKNTFKADIVWEFIEPQVDLLLSSLKA